MGLPQPNPMISLHPLAYEQYNEVSAYGGSRLRYVYTHGPGPLPLARSRDPHLGYFTWNQPSPSHGPSMPGYPSEHELSVIPAGGTRPFSGRVVLVRQRLVLLRPRMAAI
jgi:hypothetical protein